MKYPNWPLVLLFSGTVLLSPAWGALYHWVDESGVQYYSNEPPLGDAEIVNVLPETPFDEGADEERMERYDQWRRQQHREFQDRMERIRAEEEARRQEERRQAEEARKRREEERKAREQAEAEKLERRKSDEKSVYVNPKQVPLGLNPGAPPQPPENGLP